MASGLVADAVVQVHPTLACNLRCAHCYSNSGPGAGRDAIPAAELLPALDALRGEGYRVLSISGGEPFAYRELDELVHGAAAQGYRVNLVTNGMLVSERRLAPLAASLSFVAVSVDGAEEHHNELRRSPRAFSGALDGMDTLRRHGVRFGVVMTVRRTSLEDIPDVYDVCRDKGAALLSLRPLAALGRGGDLGSDALDTPTLARLFLATQVLDGLDEGLHVRTDTVPAAWLADHADPTGRGDGDRPLAERVNPLVIDEAGAVLPFAYGVHPRYGLGQVADVESSLGRLRRSSLDDLGQLVRSTASGLDPADEPYVDWFARLAHRSQATPQPATIRPLARR